MDAGVAGSPSPVCQMPNLPPAQLGVPPVAARHPWVWKPHSPKRVLYSQRGLLVMPVPRLAGWRKGIHPPLLLSKLQGTSIVFPAAGIGFRIPKSRAPFGMMSSPGSRVPLLFTSSPRVLVTTVPPSTRVNIEAKVMSSSGTRKPRNGSSVSALSITRFRFRSRTSRPPFGKSVE